MHWIQTFIRKYEDKDGRIKLQLRLKMGYKGVEWLQLAQNRIQWQALFNMVMNLGFHKMWGVYLPAEQV
jgi:hypothetical protein